MLHSVIMPYLFLSSTDSLEYHPNNVSHDFTVELLQEMQGSFRIALCEIMFTSVTEDLYIFCDIAGQSQVKDELHPLLRIVSAPGEFSSLYFHKVSTPVFRRIRIYICNADMKEPTVNIGDVRCTLLIDPI